MQVTKIVVQYSIIHAQHSQSTVLVSSSLSGFSHYVELKPHYVYMPFGKYKITPDFIIHKSKVCGYHCFHKVRNTTTV